MPDLGRHSLFEGVAPEALNALQSVSVLRQIVGGEALVRQGDDADALYFVESGRFRVVINKKRIVAHIETGEAVGELAFFAGGKRTADVVATRDSRVREVSRLAFDEIAARYPELNVAMLKLVSERLAVATARTSSISTNIRRVIAMLPAGSSKLPDGLLMRLANAFEAVVAPDTPVIPIDRATSEAGDAREYQSWLAEQEAKGAYVLIDGSGPEDWGEMVCRNADGSVMVARPGQTDPEPNAMEVAAMRWIALVG